ncbi:hypothetical protein PR048_022318 [Dryococelus australis]|uniref:Uncharacterized protein n=1 Tax=Dryococelus australis TaxID=614101 RepID=A0ABQ9H0M9_9NEOP|nr:hypothetical protein PR048_022318 [Dryococelus australis]
MQRNTPRLSTGKSQAELLVGRRLRTVFDNMHPNRQACKLQQMPPFQKFHPEQRVCERRLTVVLTTERQMCYKILQENGVVEMPYLDQLRDRGKDYGMLDPPPHRLLPPLPPAAHAGNDCPLAIEEVTGQEDEDQASFFGFPEERSEYNTFTEVQQKGTTRGELIESRSKELSFDGAPSPILRRSQRAGAGTNSRYNDFV